MKISIDEENYLVYESRAHNTVEIVEISFRSGSETQLLELLINELELPCNIYLIIPMANTSGRIAFQSMGFKHISFLPKFYIHKMSQVDAIMVGRTIWS